MHKARDELLKHRTRLLSWKCDSLLCKSSGREKNFDMHNESLYVPLLLPDFQLCYAMWLATCLFNETQFTYTHIYRISERLKRQLLFLPSFFHSGPGKRRKIKWLNMLFCFAYEYPLPCFHPMILFVQFRSTIPSIAEWETSSTSQTCNSTKI